MTKAYRPIWVLIALATACAKQEPVEEEASAVLGQQALTQSDVLSGKPDVANVDAVLRAEPQARIAKANPNLQVSTRLTVRFHRNGEIEVIDAVEFPGYLKLEKHLGRRYVYEASLGGQVLAVQGIDADFTQRSVSPERDVTSEVESMEVYIDIPGIGVDEAEGVEVALHEIASSHDEKFASIASIGRLRQSGKLKRAANLDNARVRQFVRANARRVRAL